MASDLGDCWSLADIHAIARGRLDQNLLQMINGGAGEGAAVDRNSAAFAPFLLRPRMLTGVDMPSLETQVLGIALAAPLMFAPSGLHGLAHSEGELATARAAASEGLGMVLSAGSSVPIEEVAAVGAPLWFQLYWGRDREAVRALVDRAKAAGARAICLTLDMPARPWLNGAMRLAVSVIGHVRPAHGTPRSAHLESKAAWDHDARLTWEDLGWLRSIADLPLVLKGIMTAEDASLACQHGADAVFVSNHGGRVLERGSAPIEVLAEIVEAVAGRCEIYLDGGIRSGSDIAIALALGARAVMIGRPVQWGLAAGGSAGVSRVVELLLGELGSVMTMLGAASPAALSPAHIRRAR